MTTNFKQISSENQEFANAIYSKLSKEGRKNFKSALNKGICNLIMPEQYEQMMTGTLENAKSQYKHYSEYSNDIDTKSIYMSLVNDEVLFPTLMHIINTKSNAANAEAGNIELKKWYGKNVAKDEFWESLNNGVTLNDCYNTLFNGCGKHFYDFIGVEDSLVRERIFRKLAEIYSTDYSEIYNMWLVK